MNRALALLVVIALAALAGCRKPDTETVHSTGNKVWSDDWLAPN